MVHVIHRCRSPSYSPRLRSPLTHPFRSLPYRAVLCLLVLVRHSPSYSSPALFWQLSKSSFTYAVIGLANEKKLYSKKAGTVDAATTHRSVDIRKECKVSNCDTVGATHQPLLSSCLRRQFDRGCDTVGATHQPLLTLLSSCLRRQFDRGFQSQSAPEE
jgi:hypothetical protein